MENVFLLTQIKQYIYIKLIEWTQLFSLKKYEIRNIFSHKKILQYIKKIKHIIEIELHLPETYSRVSRILHYEDVFDSRTYEHTWHRINLKYIFLLFITHRTLLKWISIRKITIWLMTPADFNDSVRNRKSPIKFHIVRWKKKRNNKTGVMRRTELYRDINNVLFICNIR